MTVQKAYQRAIKRLKLANIDSAELDARILLEQVVNKDYAYILTHPEIILTNNQNAKYLRLIKRRTNLEPIAYITGHKEFYGLDFLVNKNVLIPRPETEQLLEQAIEIIKKDKSKKFAVLDMGTGSGCMIIYLAKKFNTLNNLSFFAADISKGALSVAKKNAFVHEVKAKIKFINSDLFKNKLLHKKFGLIIANLPYVPITAKSSKQKVESIDFEPQSAIFADDNGAAIIKRFLTQAKNYLAKDGAILLELDPRNAMGIKKFAMKIYPNAKIEIMGDLAKHERYLKIQLF